MPLYHFDLVNMKTNVDVGDAELPDDIEAIDCADKIARQCLDIRPDVKNHEFSVLEGGENAALRPWRNQGRDGAGPAGRQGAGADRAQDSS
jgi:hypothetical protein